jgi:hypothetical protein
MASTTRTTPAGRRAGQAHCASSELTNHRCRPATAQPCPGIVVRIALDAVSSSALTQQRAMRAPSPRLRRNRRESTSLRHLSQQRKSSFASAPSAMGSLLLTANFFFSFSELNAMVYPSCLAVGVRVVTDVEAGCGGRGRLQTSSAVCGRRNRVVLTSRC